MSLARVGWDGLSALEEVQTLRVRHYRRGHAPGEFVTCAQLAINFKFYSCAISGLDLVNGT